MQTFDFENLVITAINVDGRDDESAFRKRFKTLLELGRGGMARVFLAESVTAGIRKLVVLKVLNRELSVDPEMRAAFRREAEVSARVNHPNVVQVFEVVEQAGQPMIVMEYLEGLSLSRVLAKSSLPLALHLDILSQVLAGLHHFHDLKDVDETPLNAVHRDVSPQNVLVLHDGVAKVLDFGIAKVTASSNADDHTRAGLIKGKIHYMPPEQLAGDAEIDRRADVFAVGVMMWEALAGRRMWQGLSSQQVVRALARGELPAIGEVAPGVPAELEAIVNRALQPEREARFASAEEMQRALEQAITKTFGSVRRRELSAFMQQHFAEYRQLQQRRVDEARRNPNLDSGVTEYLTSSVLPAATATIPDTVASGARTSVVQPDRRRSLRIALGLGGAVLFAGLVAAATFVAVQGRFAQRPAPTEQRADEVHFQLLVEPAEAEIVLDGVKLGTERYADKRARSSKSHDLVIRAAGYRPRHEVIRFDDDVLRLVRLDPLPAEPSPPAAVPTPPAATEALEAPARGVEAPPSRQGQERPGGEPRTRGGTKSKASSGPGADSDEAPTSEPVASEPVSAPEPPPVASPPPSPAAPVAKAVATPPPVAAARPPEPKLDKPRLVSSKVGHARLAVNAAQDPYRPRLPKALQYLEQTFDTSVAICVSSTGSVSSVKVINSADAAIDRQVASTITRWRYQPMLEDGRAVPFCYPLRIQLTGG